MAISQSKYIQITSGVGGQTAATRKELIGRIFSNNAKIPVNTVLEFSSLASVAEYFGTSSSEYQAAHRYFGYVNKYQSSPSKLSYFRNDIAGVAPFIYGTVKPNLAALKEITAGSMSLSMGGISYALENINLSGATSFSDIASSIQSALRANTAGGTLWTEATVSFDSVSSTFVLTGGEIGNNAIVAPEVTDLSRALGFASNKKPILSQGVAASTYTELLNRSFNISNNFGSFHIMANLSVAEIADCAAWTSAKNVQCIYSESVNNNYSEVVETVQDYSGVVLTYDIGNYYGWVIPMAIQAATNFGKENGTVSYDFTQFPNATVSVADDQLYTALSGAKINFYGATQQSGKSLAFYQHGTLQGQIEDIGVFSNEIWLKDAMATAFLNLQVNSSKWPANADGLNIGKGIAIGIILEAQRNGTILKAKELTNAQKAYITQMTGDANAWRDVYNDGYKYIAEIREQEIDGINKFVYAYQLIYSKGDSIRFVDGTHTLI